MAGGATDPEAERLKGQGNEKLKAGSARKALEIYEKALARLPVKASAGALSTLSASLCLNAALACLQLETWEAAESFASRALRSEETSKGYFRRGLARAQMNGLEADAKRDFEFALKLEPKGSTAAVLVQTELAKLLSNSAASGYEAPPGTEPRRAKKFQIANASKQQQGLREVTFAEWEALEGKVAAANAIASAWRKRLEEASNCPRPTQGADDSRVPLSKLLEKLAKESKPRAASNASALGSGSDIVPVEVALGSEPASGAIRGELGALQLLVPGPFLFDGKTSVDVPFDPLANPTGSFAVECWAVCTAATGHQCLLSSRDQTSGKAGYMFYVEPDGLWSFWVGTGKSWAKLYGSTAVLGKWTHLRGTMDVQSKEARLYVDHQLAARGWASYVPNTRQALRLGAGNSEAEAKFFFTGDLRDVAVIGRLVSNEDLTDEMLKLAKVRGPQVGPDLDQLPKLLRQEKGRGLQNASGALASALRWATGVLVPANAEDFRRSSLRLMECSPTAQGMRLLFLSFSIGAVLAAQGDELHMTFGGSGLRYWAVILQSGDCFKILYDVEGVSSLQEALSRQQKLRADAWLTRKDVAMWLGAIRAITAVFLKDTLDAAHNDAEHQLAEGLKKKAQYVSKLENFFQQIDHGGNGMITEERLNAMLENPRVKAYFETLDLAVHEGTALFHILDNGDGEVTLEEFIDGILRCKGPARAIDQVAMQADLKGLDQKISLLLSWVQEGKVNTKSAQLLRRRTERKGTLTKDLKVFRLDESVGTGTFRVSKVRSSIV